MKNKILGVAIIAALTITASWNFQQNQKQTKLSDLTLANVEALASGEDTSGKICFYPGTTTYDEFIPCDAEYPNIGKCKERKWGYYSKDKAQCFE
ncbi:MULTISPECIES: NVEALA domain-containing protein [Parabacteroides]|uniref:NVEALA domain-containing protein n=1 Tax=Parabacteroides TaxID=375288 RepID=UPI000F00B668|nr:MULTISPECIES: NVEALA domain-containing protein [Parabacteroides]MCS2892379.1 NVEALA domain-containing protein [Parabacteroides faecis]RHR92509.1 hypothetical protein DWW23_24240 [Parabacteroides sp. AF14-59]UVQ48980.1 NVEALA domain-containing protein [Parabacteroides faecis]